MLPAAVHLLNDHFSETIVRPHHDVVSSFVVGLFYLIMFGVGTVLSMGLLTLLMGIPFAISGQFERVNRVIAGVAGVSSISFGLFLMYELAVVDGF